MAVFEICKPAFCGAIHVRNNYLQTLPIRAFGFGSNHVFELLQALSAWPFVAAFEVISQEVKATTLRGVNDAGLIWMQR